MSLDYHLEADKNLSLNHVESALISADWKDIKLTGNVITGWAPGFLIHAKRLEHPESIVCENTRGLAFPKYLHCYIRAKEPNSNDVFNKFLESIKQTSEANFLVSFQFETLMFWRDDKGLHRA